MRSARVNIVFAFIWTGLSLAKQVPISTEESGLTEPPLLGFGTWNLKIDAQNTSDAISAAIQTGYRHIDCAAIYGNEKEVGRGIRDGMEKANISRKDLWITSKLWNDAHDPAEVPKALRATLNDLGVVYLDLYLMHWPVAKKDGKYAIDYLDTWEAMNKLDRRLVRSTGVSNFSPAQLTDLMNKSSIQPFAHQFELHPYLQQDAWLHFHAEHGIHVTAYSPLGNLNPTYAHGKKLPTILKDRDISNIAEQSGCTNVQVALSWGMSRGTSVIPKSSHVERIQENFNSTKCDLGFLDLTLIAAIQLKFVKRFNDPSEGWGLNLYEGLEGK